MVTEATRSTTTVPERLGSRFGLLSISPSNLHDRKLSTMYFGFSPELNAAIDAGVAKYGQLELAKRFMFHYMRKTV